VQREQLRGATDSVREPLALLGYQPLDADGLLWSAGTGAVVHGAAALLGAFDREQAQRPLCVCAAGGSGVELVRRSEAAPREAQLRAEFANRTGGAQLCTASVPYERDREVECIRWLALALADAGDQAPVPAEAVQRVPAQRCVQCARPAADGSGAKGAPHCAHCRAALGGLGPGSPESVALSDVAEEGRVVVLCAGENPLALLSSAQDLETLGALTALLRAVISYACADAERGLRSAKRAGQSQWIAPRSGGTELVVLLPPSRALRFATELVRSVQSATSEAARVAGGLSDALGHRLGQLGLSVGMVAAEASIPAWRTLARARAAGAAASRTRASRGWRSALCVDRWVVGDAGDSGVGEIGRELRAYSLVATAWQSTLHRASALRRIPASQRGTGPARQLVDPEYLTVLRYQVARRHAWRRYLRASGVDWRDPAALESARADRGLELLMELVP